MKLENSFFLAALDDVVDFEDGSDSFRRLRDGSGADQDRLDDVLLQNVGDASTTDVDASGFLVWKRQKGSVLMTVKHDQAQNAITLSKFEHRWMDSNIL